MGTPFSLPGWLSPKLIATILYVASLLLILAVVLNLCDGHLIYALDDSYISLAQAEGIAHGEYGLNQGEITSPCSSILWPFLMVVGVGTTWHGWLPFLVNFVMGTLTAWLIGRIVEDFPLNEEKDGFKWKQLGVIILFIFGSNLVSVVFVGLEHSVQLYLAALAAYGLLQVWKGEPLPTASLIVAVLGPAVRYEMFSITAAIVVVLASQRRWKTGIVVFLASLVMPLLLALFLISHGLSPLPNSVMLKTGAFDGGHFSVAYWIQSGLNRVLFDDRDYPPRYFEIALIFVLACAAWKVGGPRRWILAAACLTPLLHLFFGRFGWFYRYEDFSLLFAGIILYRAAAPLLGTPFYYGIGFLMVGALPYMLATILTPFACENMYLQQYQMHRFVNGYYQKNVAVNDIGWVSYQRDRHIYVLDLVGLSSNESLAQKDHDAPWLDAITRKHDCGLVMIYDAWFLHVPPDWVPVGRLTMYVRNVIAGDIKVSFYATPCGNPDEIRRELRAFAPTLPAQDKLDILP